MARARLIDVARAAGVTIGTASKALSGKDRIPESTRQRVREAAERLGYTPNPVAQALTSGRLPLVGLVVSALRRPGEFEDSRAYWSALIGGAALTAAGRGYAVTLIPEFGEAAFSSLPYAGLVVLDPTDRDPDLDRVLATGIPVAPDSSRDDPRILVRIDVPWGEAVRIAFDHLAERGSRMPGLIWPDLATDFSRRLREAQRTWCAERGVRDLAADAEIEGSGPGAAVEWLLDQGADGLFTCVAAHHQVVAAAAKRGLRVGEDLLVATLDEPGFESIFVDPLTTVVVDVPGSIEATVEAFADVIEGRAAGPIVIGSTFSLVERPSTAGRR